MKAILEIQQLSKSHLDSKQQHLFTQVNASITEPEMIALLGTSGQGKSTLLRILSLLDAPDEGDILFHNQSYKSYDPRKWRMKVCYVAQQAVMLPGTIEDNLKTVSTLHRISYDQALAVRLLKALGLEHLELNKQASDCSGGEKQRISLIRSLLLRPEILLLDEITASLDQKSKQWVEEVLLQWHEQEGSTMIIVTHDLQQARKVSKRVWFMGEHTLLEDTATAAFFTQPATELARGFIHLPEKEESPCP